MFYIFTPLKILELVKTAPLKYFRKNNLKTLHIFICPWVGGLLLHLDISGIYQYHSGRRNRFNQPLHLVSLPKIYTELIMSNLQGAILNLQGCKEKYPDYNNSDSKY